MGFDAREVDYATLAVVPTAHPSTVRAQLELNIGVWRATRGAVSVTVEP